MADETQDDVFVLLRDVPDAEGGYTDVCGVTRDSNVAAAWDAGGSHYVKHVPIGGFDADGYENMQF